MEQVTGHSPNYFPLSRTAGVHHANALQEDWTGLLKFTERTFIFGNPPFIGQTYQDAEQKADTRRVWNNHKKTGVMDFVSNWFLISGRIIAEKGGKAGFVATNSLTQGEQVPPLWQELARLNLEIDFAHRTFSWSNEAKGKAAVHVVIVGLSRKQDGKKGPRQLWVYEDPRSPGALVLASRINPYLIDAAEVVVASRSKPLSPELPPMLWGSKPTDNGLLSKINPEEAAEIRLRDPIAAKYLRRIIGAQELISDIERYCLWLDNAEPSDLASSGEIKRRVEAVRDFRLASPASLTRENSKISHLFVQRAQPRDRYIAVPSVSSESRKYVPMGYFEPEVIANNLLLTVPNAGLDTFSVLMSKPFNVWNSVVSGRLESRFRISQEITYNNFPLPELTEEQKGQLAVHGQAILDARAQFTSSSLADLYGPSSMPEPLLRAHQANDKAVLQVFGLKPKATDEEILSRLFTLYSEMTSGLLEEMPIKVRRARKS